MRQLEEQIRVLVEESSARKRKRGPGPVNQTSLMSTPSLPTAQASAGKTLTFHLIFTFLFIHLIKSSKP
jgi:hypothetical protein